jgi:sRNA-binding carbon storage regulator CsrA
MSLILGVSKGEKIFLNEIIMNVISTSDDMKNIQVSIGDDTYNLTDQRFIEVYPEVFAAVGKPRYETTDTLTRIAIDAPRSMKILRSSNKNYARNH